MKNHEKSKQHLKNVKDLLQEVAIDDEEDMVDEVAKELEKLEDIKNDEPKTTGGKSKKQKKKAKNAAAMQAKMEQAAEQFENQKSQKEAQMDDPDVFEEESTQTEEKVVTNIDEVPVAVDSDDSDWEYQSKNKKKKKKGKGNQPAPAKANAEVQPTPEPVIQGKGKNKKKNGAQQAAPAKPNLPTNPLECGYCGEIFESKTKVLEHLKKKHKLKF